MKKILLFKNGQNGPRMVWIGVFAFFGKNLSLVFPGNNVKWKFILLFIIHCKNLILQNSVSQVMSWNAPSQSDCRILWSVIS